MRGFTLIGILCAMAALARPVAAETVAMPPIYADPDLADDAAAVELLVRSAFIDSGAQLIAGAELAKRGQGLSLSRASEQLAALDIDAAVLIEFDHVGGLVVASVHVVGRDGKIRARGWADSKRGDAAEMAREIAAVVGPGLSVTAATVPDLTIGQLRRFAVAERLVVRERWPEAAAQLAGAEPLVAARVPAATRIAKQVWSHAPLPLAGRLEAAGVGATPAELFELAAGDLTAPARAARALAHVTLGDRTAAERELLGLEPGVDTYTAFAAIADLAGKAAARDAHVATLLAGAPSVRDLRWLAGLAPGILPAPTEAAIIGAAGKLGDARLMSVLGLRAAEASIEVTRAIALINVRELDAGELRRLLAIADRLPPGPATVRLNAQLAMQRGDFAGAKAALAEISLVRDPEAAAMRGEMAWAGGDLGLAAEEYDRAGLDYDRARVALARGDAAAADAALAGEPESRLSLIADGDLALSQGDAQGARTALERAADLAPGSRAVQTRLANALEASGDSAAAAATRALVGELVEFDPFKSLPVPGAAAGRDPRTPVKAGSGAAPKATTTPLDPVVEDVLAVLANAPGFSVTRRRYVLAPMSIDDGFFQLRTLDRDTLERRLVTALEAPATQSKVVARHDSAVGDPPDQVAVWRLAEANGATTVVAYHLAPTPGRATLRLQLFDLEQKRALELRGEVRSDSVVALNNKLIIAGLALLGLGVGLIVVKLVRGTGKVTIAVTQDPLAKDIAMALVISKRGRPKISSPSIFRATSRKRGVRRRARDANMITNATTFKIPPGAWQVHLYGVYTRGGVDRIVEDSYSKAITVQRKVAQVVTFDLTPPMGEVRVRLIDDQREGIAVWLGEDAEHKVLTDAEGCAVLQAPVGPYTLYIETGDLRFERQVNLNTNKVELVDLNLARERRLAKIADGIDLGTADETMTSETRERTPDRGPAGTPMFVTAAGLDLEGLGTTPAAANARAAGLGATTALPAGAAAGIGARTRRTTAGPGDLLAGRYRVVSQLGRGAMGVVCRAHDENLEREVAIKVLANELREHPDAMRLFTEEAKALAQLNHPNIVSVYDQTSDANDTYLVMEFVDGRTLEALISDRGRLPLATSLALIDQLCAGLAYAHGRRVIHRDIKPANIFISSDKIVKLGDFGLARVMKQISLKRTEVRGTPLYMAPEQIQGKDVSHRADLYAVGCTLYELACGRPPFVEGEILFHHLYTPHLPPSTLQPDLPLAFDDLIAACLAKDPLDRVESAAAVRELIRAVL